MGDVAHRCGDEGGRGVAVNPHAPARDAVLAALRTGSVAPPPAGRAAACPPWRGWTAVRSSCAGRSPALGRLRDPGRRPLGVHAVPQGHDRGPQQRGGGSVPGFPARLHPPGPPGRRLPSGIRWRRRFYIAPWMVGHVEFVKGSWSDLLERLQQMRLQAREMRALWSSVRRSQRTAKRLNWWSRAKVCSTT